MGLIKDYLNVCMYDVSLSVNGTHKILMLKLKCKSKYISIGFLLFPNYSFLVLLSGCEVVIIHL